VARKIKRTKTTIIFKDNMQKGTSIFSRFLNKYTHSICQLHYTNLGTLFGLVDAMFSLSSSSLSSSSSFTAEPT
jgi:hypothetical protein